MNVWIVESCVDGKYYQPVAMEYSRDQARYTQKQMKIRSSLIWNSVPKSRIRKYTQDPYSRG